MKYVSINMAKSKDISLLYRIHIILKEQTPLKLKNQTSLVY